MMTKMNQAKTMLMSILSAAILLLGLSACSAGEFDNPVSNNPLGSQVADVCKQANDADRTHFTVNQRLKPQEGATVVCNIPADKQGQYKYYRVECSGSPGDYALAELTLNYE